LIKYQSFGRKQKLLSIPQFDIMTDLFNPEKLQIIDSSVPSKNIKLDKEGLEDMYTSNDMAKVFSIMITETQVKEDLLSILTKQGFPNSTNPYFLNREEKLKILTQEYAPTSHSQPNDRIEQNVSNSLILD
jgi:hypothetical protein